MLNHQLAAASALVARAADVEEKFTHGEANLQVVMNTLEGRLSDNENKLADGLSALSTTMAGFTPNFEQRLAASETHMGATMRLLTPGRVCPAPPNLARPQEGYAPPGAWATKTKDFVHILPFDRELTKFPDWSDRIVAKLQLQGASAVGAPGQTHHSGRRARHECAGLRCPRSFVRGLRRASRAHGGRAPSIRGGWRARAEGWSSGESSAEISAWSPPTRSRRSSTSTSSRPGARTSGSWARLSGISPPD